MSDKELSNLDGLSFPSSSSYTILQEIGRGGMGIVYLAEKHCEGVDDLVVLKTIRTVSPEHIEMLKKEANIATHLRHENIVKTYGLESIPVSALPAEFQSEITGLEYQEPAPQKPVRRRNSHLRRNRSSRPRRVLSHSRREGEQKLYLIAMDYVEGTDLGNLYREHLHEKILVPPILTSFIISRICRALGYAHKSIIHRDISPENIMVDNQGVSKLSDFGIAVGGDEEISLLTGKLGYMSPEQINRKESDHRADIFSLGVVSYQMLTGINLFLTPRKIDSKSQIEYIRQKHARTILPPHQVMNDIPLVLSEIIMKMLSMDPEKRYQDAISVGNDLEQKYMYAEGFGPTNNSIQSYLEIHESHFKEYTQEQLKQLRFLQEDGKIRLRRAIRPEIFTSEGLELVKQYRGTLLHRLLVS